MNNGCSTQRAINLTAISNVMSRNLAEAIINTDWEDDIDLNFQYLIKMNTVQWIKVILRGEDPHQNRVKSILERIKVAMISYEQHRRPNGVDQATVKLIENIFEAIYKL